MIRTLFFAYGWRQAFLACGVAFCMTAFSGGPALSQFDTANAAHFWVQERERIFKPVNGPSIRAQKLAPHRKIARPSHGRSTADRARGSQPAFVKVEPPPNAAAPLNRSTAIAPDTITPEPPASASEQTVAAIRTPASEAKAMETKAMETQAWPVVGSPPAAPKKVLKILILGDAITTKLVQGLSQTQNDADLSIGVLASLSQSPLFTSDEFEQSARKLRDFIDQYSKADVLATMVGFEDRRELRDSFGRHEPFSAHWLEIYQSRVATTVEILRASKKPLVWIGLPVVKSVRVSAENRQLNKIFRASVESVGARYMEIYDLFADDKGDYGVFGADLSGRIEKLRTADGVGFTAAGEQKLAHFFAAALSPMSENLSLSIPSHEPSAPLAASPVTTAARMRPEIGSIINLTAAPQSDPTTLGGLGDARGDKTFSKAASPELAEGCALAAKPGRADDFVWPRP